MLLSRKASTLLSLGKRFRLSVFRTLNNHGSGNAGDDASLYSPGRVASVTTVGAIDKGDNSAPYRFVLCSGALQSILTSFLNSNWGSAIDIWAPGSAVLSDWIGGPAIGAELSGTSSLYFFSIICSCTDQFLVATPLVAGMVAYLVSLYGNPTPKEMKYVLRSSCFSLSLIHI